jgi:flagellar basal body-associated protein FliL
VSKKAAAKPEKAADPAPEGSANVVEAGDGVVAPPKRRLGGLLPVIKAIAFVAVLVVVEVVAASMFVPSAQDTERLAKQYVAASQGQTDPTGAETAAHGGESKAVGETEEVELGTFNVTHFNPAANATLSIDFELFGSVLASDEKEFHTLLEKNKVRVREQIIMTLHAADAKDLSDAGLGLLKRQILEKTNRALGQPLLKEVLFSKFNFVER